MHIPKGAPDTAMTWLGLTIGQCRDLDKVNRSHTTGRRLRQSGVTRLELISKKNNWSKLVVKGAAVQLTQIAHDLQITNEQDLLSLTKAISKIETILLNKLSELYEAQKAYELNERAKWKAAGWGKPTNEHFKETIKDNFAEQYLLSQPPLAEK